MKNLCLLLLSAFIYANAHTQITGSFVVNGDIDKYYPVTFVDGNWNYNVATELQIGRVNIHTDAEWRGSLISTFKYHSILYGHGAQFIDANIRTGDNGAGVAINNFIAGWQDASASNSSDRIIIWLRGGSTTYFYNANANVNPAVYDGVQNALPYHEENGPDHTFKTSKESYVNSQGLSLSNDLFVSGSAKLAGNVGIGTATPQTKLHVVGTGSSLNTSNTFNGDLLIQATMSSTTSGAQLEFANPANSDNSNPWGQGRIITVANNVGGEANAIGKMILGTRRFFSKNNLSAAWYYGDDITIDGTGNVGIGITSPTEKLSVNGTILSKKIKVTQQNWPDYVFDSSYTLAPLSQVEQFIKNNKHLPDVPSAKEVADKGLDVGDNQAVLLKKIEELTLYMIEQSKKTDEMKKEVESAKKINEERFQKLESENLQLKKELQKIK
ncbi:hypothetical protein ACI6Q2_10645 [Chitinophagaceae bacterium LWZ2-11]